MPVFIAQIVTQNDSLYKHGLFYFEDRQSFFGVSASNTFLLNPDFKASTLSPIASLISEILMSNMQIRLLQITLDNPVADDLNTFFMRYNQLPTTKNFIGRIIVRIKHLVETEYLITSAIDVVKSGTVSLPLSVLESIKARILATKFLGDFSEQVESLAFLREYINRNFATPQEFLQTVYELKFKYFRYSKPFDESKLSWMCKQL